MEIILILSSTFYCVFCTRKISIIIIIIITWVLLLVLCRGPFFFFMGFLNIYISFFLLYLIFLFNVRDINGFFFSFDTLMYRHMRWNQKYFFLQKWIPNSHAKHIKFFFGLLNTGDNKSMYIIFNCNVFVSLFHELQKMKKKKLIIYNCAMSGCEYVYIYKYISFG